VVAVVADSVVAAAAEATAAAEVVVATEEVVSPTAARLLGTASQCTNSSLTAVEDTRLRASTVLPHLKPLMATLTSKVKPLKVSHLKDPLDTRGS